MLQAVHTIAALPATVPFVGPETLAREQGIPSAMLLRLGANESNYGPAPCVLAQLADELGTVAAYPDPEIWELRQALSAHYGRSIQEVTVASGIDELLALIVRAFLGAGEAAVATLGSYPTFAYQVHGHGGRLVGVEYRNRQPDLLALITAVERERARMVYLANPDNPSGALHSAAAVESFCHAIPASCLIVLDEAYAEYAGDVLPARLPENVIRLRTFSKAYGLAGLRIGYALAEPELQTMLNKIRLHFGVNRLAQVAALAALSASSYMSSVVAETSRGRAEYQHMAQTCGLHMYPSATNFVLVDMTTPRRAQALVDELFARHVFIRKPSSGALADCVRITIGTANERQILRARFIEALAAVEAKDIE